VPNPIRETLAFPEFRAFIVGRFCFIMGLRMLGTLVGWWMYELTRDPFYIGLIGLAEAVPAVGLALYAGYVIDKSEKRKLLLTTVLLYAFCMLILLGASTHGFKTWAGKDALLFVLYAVIFATGAIRSFSGPAFGAIIATLVPRNMLVNASQISSSTWLIASISGHAAAGFLIAGLGISGTLGVVLGLVGFGFLSLRKLSAKPSAGTGDKKTWEAVKEGLHFVYRTKEVLAALSLDLFAVLFGGAVALIPVYASEILQVGPIGFGWLNAAMDIGAILMVIWLTLRPLRGKQGLKLLLAVGGFGACIVVFGLSTWYALSFATLVLAGMLDGVSVVVRSNIVQLKTPDALRGRVMSVNSMFINSSNEIGQFESGVAARFMGTVTSVVFGGIMTMSIVAITWFKAPSLRKLEY
jgi:MFS family permease